MRILIAEDESTSRRMLQKLLSQFGQVEVAVDGAEAVEAARCALSERRPFDLICLDIAMPRMNGHEALAEIRLMERSRGLADGTGAKVMMTTAMHDAHNVVQAFRNQCETYLVKPIDRASIAKALLDLGLTDSVPSTG